MKSGSTMKKLIIIIIIIINMFMLTSLQFYLLGKNASLLDVHSS